MSRTRSLMAHLRHARGENAPLVPTMPLPRVEAPPARVYVPARETTSSTAAAAAKHTTALLGIGHVGTRYATDVVLQFQAELAVAHSAVAAELPEEWAAQHGFLPLQSQATSHREFLLRPDLGRRLHPDSLARLRKDAQRGPQNGANERTLGAGPDVQLILADGLSAIACMGSGEQLFAATKAACAARGLSVGTPVCAKFARVWLQDEIGAEVGAKVAIILLGERPGLGTGDGLSAYAVYGPKIGNTDGERNMMSNLHARGIAPEEAAPRLAALAAAMIAQGVSGVKLDLTGIGAGGREYRAPQVRERWVVRDA